MAVFSKFMRKRKLLAKLRGDSSGVAMVEFAFAAPVVLTMGLMGAETANYVVTHMQLSQLAMQVADNASRIGEKDVLVARKVFEDDVNESLVGGEKLGESIAIYEQGRVVISSLQRNSDNGQWIAWQRCRGAKNYTPRFGEEGAGASGTTFPGMGTSGQLIRAAAQSAVIFVEVSYDYRSITPFDWLDGTEIQYTAAFNIRDARDLTQLYQTNPPSPVADCDVYSADRPT